MSTPSAQPPLATAPTLHTPCAAPWHHSDLHAVSYNNPVRAGTVDTLCVMESRPDGRAVSVCEPSARSCEHTHVPMGYPPITLAMPW